MSKIVISSQAFCGIDVSAATLDVAVQRIEREVCEHHQFPNSAAGHRELIAWLQKRGAAVRVVLEATGIYSFDLALALDGAAGLEVAVLNPKVANRFAQSLNRSKTDKADAAALAEHSRRMKFVPWRRPSEVGLQLRAVGRHLAALGQDRTRLSNRLEAAKGSAATPRCVLQDLKRGIDAIEKRIGKLRRAAVAMIATDEALKRKSTCWSPCRASPRPARCCC